MIRKTALTLTFLSLFVSIINSQTQSDTIFSYISNSTVTIDGAANEDCWTNADWHAIDQVWMPYGASMNDGDFEGKFKVSWDEEFLYLLVEVIDDSLSDDHISPTDSWWADDCLEVFIDEDRSKGNHQTNNNAFAYHVSIFYDAIDLNSSGNGINYKDHIEVVMDTVAENTYLWEIAIKIYDDTYTTSNEINSRVDLTPNKLMGFTLAYCDNDETTGRENFIGSMYMTSSTADDNYKNADHFGSLKLIDPSYVPPATSGISDISNVSRRVYPNPARENIIIENPGNEQFSYQIYSVSQILLLSGETTDMNHSIDISQLNSGTYFILTTDKNGANYQKFIKK